MGYIQGADRNQVILLPDTLDDYVGGDNEVRAIDAFIDSLDISLMGFKADPAKEGRPGYDPRDMLKLYMYGCLNHIRSSRRLQKEASRFERDIEKDIVICPMGQTLFYAGLGHPNGKKDPSIRRYHRLSACLKCPNKCTLRKRRIVSFKEGETRKEEAFYEKARENRIVRKTSHRFKVITLSEEESSWDEWVILRFYPNQQHLRKRNTVAGHPYGTVKRRHGAGYLLTKGKLKAAAEMGLSFPAYDFRRVINLLGVKGIMEMIMA